MTGSPDWFLDNDEPRLAAAWHPVARSADLGSGSTLPVSLLGAQHRIARDPSGSVAAEGVWGIQERYGLVWVARAAPTGALPAIDEIDRGGYRHAVLARRTSVSAGVLIDNFLDVTHFSFLHRQSFDRSRPVTDEGYHLQASGDLVRLQHDTVLQESRANQGGGRGQRRIATYTYRTPFWTHLLMEFPDDGEVASATLVCQPETATSTIAYVIVAIAPDAPDLAGQVDFSIRVLEEDLALLEQLEDQRLPLTVRTEQHTRADRASVEMRRALARSLVAGGPGVPEPGAAPAARTGTPGVAVEDDRDPDAGLESVLVWTAALSEADLDRAAGAPVAVRIDGEPWVVVRLDGQVAVLRDACPHRRVPLSAGRIRATATGDRLECAYHGWAFDGSGRCVAIPALGGDLPAVAPTPGTPRGGLHARTAAAVRVIDGMIWIAVANDVREFVPG